ncbi:MAG TPA: hypothetical protein VEA59_04055 [Patescibacteria group bacterium]|nr:hypothetical protein [Patescibacteria group bacterium]
MVKRFLKFCAKVCAFLCLLDLIVEFVMLPLVVLGFMAYNALPQEVTRESCLASGIKLQDPPHYSNTGNLVHFGVVKVAVYWKDSNKHSLNNEEVILEETQRIAQRFNRMLGGAPVTVKVVQTSEKPDVWIMGKPASSMKGTCGKAYRDISGTAQVWLAEDAGTYDPLQVSRIVYHELGHVLGMAHGGDHYSPMREYMSRDKKSDDKRPCATSEVYSYLPTSEAELIRKHFRHVYAGYILCSYDWPK